MTADITAGCTFTNLSPALGFGRIKVLMIETAATADSGDYITLTPATYGNIKFISGADATTGAIENPTWAVATGVVTLTGATTDKARTLIVYLAKN